MIDRKRDAFTLLEVTLVVVIVVVLATLSFTKFVYVIERARAVEAVKTLRKVKKLQILHKELNGRYVGNGPIEDFPQLLFNIPELEFFYNIQVHNDPMNICVIYRNDGSYHLRISDQGAIFCTVDEAQANLCSKLGFQPNGT